MLSYPISSYHMSSDLILYLSYINKSYLINKKGKFKGYPFRSFSYGTFTGGYSDHLPPYIYLLKEIK